MKAITRELNLELGRPTADEALRRLEAELEAARHMNTPLLKLIHGYGSSGKGGRIRTASRKYLLAQQEKGRIAAVVPGERFSIAAVSPSAAGPGSGAGEHGRDLHLPAPLLRKNRYTTYI